jgi:hypothetical protein
MLSLFSRETRVAQDRAVACGAGFAVVELVKAGQPFGKTNAASVEQRADFPLVFMGTCHAEERA